MMNELRRYLISEASHDTASYAGDTSVSNKGSKVIPNPN